MNGIKESLRSKLRMVFQEGLHLGNTLRQEIRSHPVRDVFVVGGVAIVGTGIAVYAMLPHSPQTLCMIYPTDGQAVTEVFSNTAEGNAKREEFDSNYVEGVNDAMGKMGVPERVLGSWGTNPRHDVAFITWSDTALLMVCDSNTTNSPQHYWENILLNMKGERQQAPIYEVFGDGTTTGISISSAIIP